MVGETPEGRPAPKDVIGIGFGPSNLALAVALAEHEDCPGGPLDTLFLERRPRFGWHPGMLLEDTTMQVSFLKDLVTLRNPVSPYGFLPYLHDKDRLADFINQKTFFPSRIEFHDYLEWVAARFTQQVEYDTEAVAVRPVVADGRVTAFEVISKNSGESMTRRRTTRNLVVASGLVPTLPEGFERGERVWHSSDLRERVGELDEYAPLRFAVIGAGQSAAEIVAHLHARFPNSSIHAVVSRYGYRPADDTPFVNRVFDPAAVDEYYDARQSAKDSIFESHGNTNYSVVDADLIGELYRRAYQELVTGLRRLFVLNMCRVSGLTTGADKRPRLQVTQLTDGSSRQLDVDMVVCATGYRQMDPEPLLGPVAKFCQRDETGQLRVDRDYRVRTADHVTAGIYLQGGTEHTHGISSSLLSNLAVRAGDITRSLLTARTATGVGAADPGPA
ncbi:lysine N(6)-hydroxylase/L-ornithine N(5)-oxygenase family protein [Streptomyces olivaceoviridis]|uniref:lysine N(6)-hydroxylase/L-ornithine N(5)-oxygenase family protein n=1 Tax=Streptomyces olivaceoviridis TaxID=1921 RepID=UPI0036FD7D90